MASVNKVILVGNCGRDPEIRYLPDGRAVANVSIATTSRRKDRNTGETIEDTQWHRVTFYERLAEIVGEYVFKGNPIYIEGRLKYGKYTDQAGVEKPTCDIIATELQLLGSRDQGQQGGQQGGQPQQPRQQAPQQRQQQRPQQAPQRQQPARQQAQRQVPTGGAGSGFDDMDDDIPFITQSVSCDIGTSKQRRMASYDF